MPAVNPQFEGSKKKQRKKMYFDRIEKRLKKDLENKEKEKSNENRQDSI